MKPFLAAALCATALTTTAAPALAQYAPPSRGPTPPAPTAQLQPGRELHTQIDNLDLRIRQGMRDGRIDGAEADRALRELARIRDEQSRLRTPDGRLSDINRGRLQDQIDHLSNSIHWMAEHGPVASPPVVIAPPPPRPVGPPPPPSGPWTLDQRESWMQQWIDQARGDHTLSRSEVYRAQRGLSDIRSLQTRMIYRSHGRLRDVDRDYLEQRLDHLRDTIRWFHDTNNAPPWARR